VLDQQHVERVHEVRRDFLAENLVGLVGAGFRADEAEAPRRPVDVLRTVPMSSSSGVPQSLHGRLPYACSMRRTTSWTQGVRVGISACCP